MAVTVFSSLFWSAILSWIPEARAMAAEEQGVVFVVEEDEELLLLEQPLLPLAFEASEINVAISTVVSLKWMLNGNANVEEASAIMSALGVRKCISNAGKE